MRQSKVKKLRKAVNISFVEGGEHPRLRHDNEACRPLKRIQRKARHVYNNLTQQEKVGLASEIEAKIKGDNDAGK